MADADARQLRSKERPGAAHEAAAAEAALGRVRGVHGTRSGKVHYAANSRSRGETGERGHICKNKLDTIDQGEEKKEPSSLISPSPSRSFRKSEDFRPRSKEQDPKDRDDLKGQQTCKRSPGAFCGFFSGARVKHQNPHLRPGGAQERQADSPRLGCWEDGHRPTDPAAAPGLPEVGRGPGLLSPEARLCCRHSSSPTPWLQVPALPPTMMRLGTRNHSEERQK